MGVTLHQFCQLGMFWSIACNIMETSQMITTVNNIYTTPQLHFEKDILNSPRALDILGKFKLASLFSESSFENNNPLHIICNLEHYLIQRNYELGPVQRSSKKFHFPQITEVGPLCCWKLIFLAPETRYA